MLTACMTTYNRPEDVERTIEGLRKNDWFGYDEFVVFSEPGESSVLDVVREIDFLPLTLIVNKTKLGVRNNPFRMFNYLFLEREVDCTLYVEDDVEISPDAAQMVRWYASLPNRDQWHVISLFTYHIYDQFWSDPSVVYEWDRENWSPINISLFPPLLKAIPEDTLIPWGLGIPRRSWIEVGSPSFCNRPTGWDGA